VQGRAGDAEGTRDRGERGIDPDLEEVAHVIGERGDQCLGDVGGEQQDGGDLRRSQHGGRAAGTGHGRTRPRPVVKVTVSVVTTVPAFGERVTTLILPRRL
jgi:hypothetical protein